MNILFVTDVFPPHCGGSGWSVYFFARALREQGHQVRIVSLDETPRVYDNFDVEAHAVGHSGIPFLGNWIRENRDLPRIAKRLDAVLSEFDIAHAHHKLSAVALGMAEPERWFVTIRDYWPICICGRSTHRTGDICNALDFSRCSEEDNRWKGLAAPLIHPWFESRLRERIALLKRANKIFCISHYLRDQLLPLLPPEQLQVLPNFAQDLEAEPPAGLPQRFMLYVGRLEQNKGVQLLPEILRKSCVDLPLLIVGEGALSETLQQELSGRAQFPGYLEYPKMLAIMKRCDFVLFPSYWAEPLGRVLIEAAMTGKPAVAFDHPGGHRDVLMDGETGLLADSVESFAAAVASLASDPALRETLGANARARYEQHFSPQAVIPKLLQAYSKS